MADTDKTDSDGQQGTNGDFLSGDLGNTFSSLNQPSFEARSAGQKKRWSVKELLNRSVAIKSGNKDYRVMAARYFDIPENEVTVENIMYFQQVRKAAQKGDTKAFNAVLDRKDGKARRAPDDTPPPPVVEDSGAQKSLIDLGPGIPPFEIG